jgi:hypothetical protein
LAGSLLLVAGWLAWFATSGPSRGPLVVHRSAPHREAPHLLPPEPLPEPEPAALDPLHPTPVLAETLGGDSLADVARELGLPGRLLAVAAAQPPGLLALAPGLPGPLDLLDRPLHPDAAFVGALPVPPEGAWVSLFLGDVLLATRRVTPGQATLRFVLTEQFLRERVARLTPIS